MTQPLSFSDQLSAVLEAHAAASDLPLSTVSWRAVGEAKALPLFVAGKSSLTLPRAEKALAWLSANWPATAVWPASVPRPSPAPVPASAGAGFEPASPAPSPPGAGEAAARCDGGAA